MITQFPPKQLLAPGYIKKLSVQDMEPILSLKQHRDHAGGQQFKWPEKIKSQNKDLRQKWVIFKATTPAMKETLRNMKEINATSSVVRNEEGEMREECNKAPAKLEFAQNSLLAKYKARNKAGTHMFHIASEYIRNNPTLKLCATHKKAASASVANLHTESALKSTIVVLAGHISKLAKNAKKPISSYTRKIANWKQDSRFLLTPRMLKVSKFSGRRNTTAGYNPQNTPVSRPPKKIKKNKKSSAQAEQRFVWKKCDIRANAGRSSSICMEVCRGKKHGFDGNIKSLNEDLFLL